VTRRFSSEAAITHEKAIQNKQEIHPKLNGSFLMLKQV